MLILISVLNFSSVFIYKSLKFMCVILDPQRKFLTLVMKSWIFFALNPNDMLIWISVLNFSSVSELKVPQVYICHFGSINPSIVVLLIYYFELRYCLLSLVVDALLTHVHVIMGFLIFVCWTLFKITVAHQIVGHLRWFVRLALP